MIDQRSIVVWEIVVISFLSEIVALMKRVSSAMRDCFFIGGGELHKAETFCTGIDCFDRTVWT